LIDFNSLGLQPLPPARPTDFASAGVGNGHAPPPEEPSRPAPRGPADGLHALLVEDQTIIALDTEAMLQELGAASVHSFTTAESAIAWLMAASADIGVLDISLGATTSFPVADALQQGSVPFIFTTGYGDSGIIPERFLDAPVVRKPYTLVALAEALTRCLRTRNRTD